MHMYNVRLTGTSRVFLLGTGVAIWVCGLLPTLTYRIQGGVR